MHATCLSHIDFNSCIFPSLFSDFSVRGVNACKHAFWPGTWVRSWLSQPTMSLDLSIKISKSILEGVFCLVWNTTPLGSCDIMRPANESPKDRYSADILFFLLSFFFFVFFFNWFESISRFESFWRYVAYLFRSLEDFLRACNHRPSVKYLFILYI